MIKQEVSITLYKLQKERPHQNYSEYTKQQRKENDEVAEWNQKQKWIKDFNYADLEKGIYDISKTFTFKLFTNKGKLSKQDKNYSEELAPFAEEALAKQLAKNEELKADQERANELAKIVNQAMNDYTKGEYTEDKELKAVSTKYSKSDWYNHGGELNMRSMYHKMVPASVIEEAKELQAIRKKHQRTAGFDFWACNWNCIEIREADHPNY